MRLIRQDPDLFGVHLVVGLSNFAWGTPKGIREDLEKAYLTLGMEAGLPCVRRLSGSPEITDEQPSQPAWIARPSSGPIDCTDRRSSLHPMITPCLPSETIAGG